MMKIAVIIPAAGMGKRFAASDSLGVRSKLKTEVDLGGRPVLIRSVELFVHRGDVEQLIVAVDPDKLSHFQLCWGDKLAFYNAQIVPGGKTERWQTVLNALNAVQDSCTHVAVHDAVRPLPSVELIDRVFEAGKQYQAVIPAVPIHGTLKRVSRCEPPEDDVEDSMDAILGTAGKRIMDVKQVLETVSRAGLVEAQTPQLFEQKLLRRAYAQIIQGSVDPIEITDDAGLVEALGQSVHTVDGEVTNLKITQAQDIELATAILASRQGREAARLGKKRLFNHEQED